LLVLAVVTAGLHLSNARTVRQWTRSPWASVFCLWWRHGASVESRASRVFAFQRYCSPVDKAMHTSRWLTRSGIAYRLNPAR